LVLEGKVMEEVAMSYATNAIELQSKLRRQKL